ncbi:M61 family metallopeptidase [Sphingomonas yantingensis]|uniref:Putative metalloprotease with PDZ domain n=1 Tax=Sphingomonas yantingensis TaxID=1241761 RepID=A0A7W9AM14_9SPHN|nr:M61 family metallopeptidase [Sphingomonas yantingensis]MBB5696712.1 putative metalloprotease with PDZ domain [Sphingomonas yantingensis]
MRRRLAFAAILLASSAAALAQQGNSMPQPLPFEDTIPAPRDVDYPGVIRLDVDATDIDRAIFRVKETVPVAQAGRMTLLMPEWLPGNHAPRGQIEKLAGLVIRANGKVLPWKRDPADVYAFHFDVPAGVKSVEASFEFLSATKADQGRIMVAPNMLNVQWEAVSLYPAGYYTRRIPIQANVKYPAGWTAASGLPSTRKGQTYAYQQTSYETLQDSPVFAGRYYREFKLSDRVDLNVFADKPEELAATPEQIAAHQRLAEQAVKLFGAQHYDHYEFLFAITDQMGGIGLEHHRSSENGVPSGYFTKWNDGPGRRNLLPHEFTHSWDGKFRRGADLWTPDFKTPMRNSMLWVYEGQTQFWGYVLQARSGLVSKQDTLDMMASIWASLDNRPGRDWRPMIDTTNDPIISARRPKGWVSYQRSEDYYNEGLLIWLDADAKLRELSGGKKSMDDFARAFFGMRDGDWGVLTYNLDDVVKTLEGIQPYDWRTFLDERVYQVNKRAPLAGFEKNGYRIVYTEDQSPYLKSAEREGTADFFYSLGLTIGKEGAVTAVRWDGPAFEQRIDVATQVVSVNGAAYTPDVLKAAITANKGGQAPIKLLLKHDDRYREAVIDYRGGLRYPRAQKIGTGESGLDRLLSAK